MDATFEGSIYTDIFCNGDGWQDVEVTSVNDQNLMHVMCLLSEFA